MGFTNRNFTALAGSGLNLYTSSVFEADSGGVYRSETLGLRWVHAGRRRAIRFLLYRRRPTAIRTALRG